MRETREERGIKDRGRQRDTSGEGVRRERNEGRDGVG